MNKLSTRALAFMSSVCIRQFAISKNIESKELIIFCEHLEGYSVASDLPDWDDKCGEFAITGLGDLIPEETASKFRTHLPEIDSLTQAARELTSSQMYTTWKYNEALGYYRELVELAGCKPVDEEQFRKHSPGKSGWGEVVSHDLFQQWKCLV